MTGPAEPALVDGVDVDAVAAAVRSCPAVDDLDGGRLGGVATYLPGRRVPGIRIEDDRVEVQVRGVWNQPVGVVVEQIQGALAPLTGGRIIDIVLSDIAEPGHDRAQLPPPATGSTPSAMPAVLADGTVEEWTTPNASAGPGGGSSSAATTPTAAETPPNS